MIKKCFCDNKFQDKKYGKKMRVFNKTMKGHRCTNCGREKLV
jgi:hypothetical protein